MRSSKTIVPVGEMDETTIADATMGVVKGSGNVFADLGIPNADEELVKADLAFAIRQRIKALELTQSEAAQMLRTDQAKISLLMNGRVRGFTLDRLLRYLNAAAMDVRITVELSAARSHGTTTVTTT